MIAGLSGSAVIDANKPAATSSTSANKKYVARCLRHHVAVDSPGCSSMLQNTAGMPEPIEVRVKDAGFSPDSVMLTGGRFPTPRG